MDAMNLPHKPKPAARAAARRHVDVLDHAKTLSAQIIILANKITARSSSLLRREFGLGTAEWRIMALLAIHGSTSPQQMCTVIAMDKAAVSRALRAMESSGLIDITPQEENSRWLTVSLNRTGRKLHDRIVAVVLERERRMTASLDPAEQALMLDMLRRMHRCVEEMPDPV